jgi:hypothetical protein
MWKQSVIDPVTIPIANHVEVSWITFDSYQHSSVNYEENNIQVATPPAGVVINWNGTHKGGGWKGNKLPSEQEEEKG